MKFIKITTIKKDGTHDETIYSQPKTAEKAFRWKKFVALFNQSIIVKQYV